MQDFTLQEFKELCDLLISNKARPSSDAEAFALAMHDIRESAVEIYDAFLPKLMEQLRSGTGDVERHDLEHSGSLPPH